MLRIIHRSLAYRLPGTVISSNHVEVAPPYEYNRPEETYKPLEVIEFDTKGETLVYSCEPMASMSVYFPIPWSLGTWLTPGLAYLFVAGGAGSFSWLLPLAGYLAILPHAWYIYQLRFYADKIWYIRGGLWKIQNSGVHRITTFTVTEPSNVKPLSVKGPLEPHRGKFTLVLDDNGNLIRDLTFKTDTWVEFYETVSDQTFKLLKSGTVHNPELFQAMAQGYKIDDSKFVINRNPENGVHPRRCWGETD